MIKAARGGVQSGKLGRLSDWYGDINGNKLDDEAFAARHRKRVADGARGEIWIKGSGKFGLDRLRGESVDIPKQRRTARWISNLYGRARSQAHRGYAG